MNYLLFIASPCHNGLCPSLEWYSLPCRMTEKCHQSRCFLTYWLIMFILVQRLNVFLFLIFGSTHFGGGNKHFHLNDFQEWYGAVFTGWHATICLLFPVSLLWLWRLKGDMFSRQWTYTHRQVIYSTKQGHTFNVCSKQFTLVFIFKWTNG